MSYLVESAVVPPTPITLPEQVELYRLEASRQLSPQTQAALGQFMTPLPVAEFMAALSSQPVTGTVRLLDPGAGVGSLTAVFIQRLLQQQQLPEQIQADLFEIDPALESWLSQTMAACQKACAAEGTAFTNRLLTTDFVAYAVEKARFAGSLFDPQPAAYTHCIMNPPYKKIRNDSPYRQKLRQAGIETSNLYAGFLALAVKLLAPGGELAAIVPRSFCNGPYFQKFRRFFLQEMSLRQIHLFDARDKAFQDDGVLQENVILYAVRGAEQEDVLITSSADISFSGMTCREAPFTEVIRPDDPAQVIRLATTEFEASVVARIDALPCSLESLGITVSTGPVVDFRVRPDLRPLPAPDSYPLIYPAHLDSHAVKWPQPDGKKPNAIIESGKTRQWLFPNGWYTVVKRISAKEEKRRLVTAVHNPQTIPSGKVGFENHLNVFHREKRGLDRDTAVGLAIYLNSTLADLYFRVWSGHTQVNAADLRMMPYPALATLQRWGREAGDIFPSRQQTDALLEAEINRISRQEQMNPTLIQNRIDEALSILEMLGLPRSQQNERSALTLLALLDLKPEDDWSDASAPLMGITPVMVFCRDYYGRNYAPNTRETFRRQTMHQFVDAGLVVPNPDDPDRPVNSPKWVYQIETAVLHFLRQFGRENWEAELADYLKQRETLSQKYARERKMRQIPLRINQEEEILLSPGGHSQLIKAIIEQFGPRFAPGSQVLYVGDTGNKTAFFDETIFAELGLTFNTHGKFPDVVLYDAGRNWLLLIEAVTSHGPVDAKRYGELSRLFSASKAGLLYVTAFPNRRLLARYLPDISWETDVWVADSPSHLIHFDGNRFLGPYENV